MRLFIRDLFGGLLIMAGALGIGIFHNSVRGEKLQLLPNALPAKIIKTQSADPADHSDTSSITDGETMTAEKAKSLLDGGAVVFIDSRSEKAFNDGHISGAINIPYDKFLDYYDNLSSTVSTDQTIICYCWGPDCDFSDNLASELAMMGYERVTVFKGGWEQWIEKGYPVETSDLNEK